MENARPLQLEVLPGRFAIHRFDPVEPVPEDALASPFFNIETLRRLSIGESLDLSFAFPRYEETISLSCHVVSNDAKGIGIQFTEPSAAAVAAIKEKSISTPSVWSRALLPTRCSHYFHLKHYVSIQIQF